MMQPGISLLECVIVVALITGIALLSLQLIVFYDHVYVRTELEKFFAFALYTQRKALIEHKTQMLTIDTVHNSYYTRHACHRLARSVLFGIKENIKGSPGSADILIKQPITFKDNQIFFYPDGTISAGTLYFTDIKKTCLYALTSAVAQIPYFRKYRYDRTWTLIT